MNLYLNFIGLLAFFMTILLFFTFCIIYCISFIYKKQFPKKLLIASLTSTIVFLGVFLYTNYLFTFDNQEGQFYKGPVNSPTEKYTANAYFINYGGAAGGVNVRVEVTNHNEKDNNKTVYYSDAKSDFSMEWEGENTLFIKNDDPEYPNSNRSIELEIGKEIYHESGLACKSWLMKDEYETCYQYK